MTTTDPTTDPKAISRFVDAIAAGNGLPADLFADDATLDATVPNWRLEEHGAAAVAAQLSTWYRHRTRIERACARDITGGVALELDLGWEDDGVPHAAHQLHLLTVEHDRIAEDVVFCGGRWPAGLLAEMEAARAR